MPARKIVLFDLDGTLSESEPGIVGCLVEALEVEGLPVPEPATLRTIIGPPFSVGLPAIGVPEDRVDAVTLAYRAIYRTRGQYETACYDGVAELLAELHQAGYVLAVATSKPEDSATEVLAHLGLDHYFTVIAGADIPAGRYAKADVIAAALERLDVAADERTDVVMVGDRVHDIEGAREHGIETIAVAWGYGGADEHAAAVPRAVAEHPRDVLRLLAATTDA